MENANKAALLVMDLQNPIIQSIENPSTIVSNVSKAIVQARVKKIPIIYMVVGFRPGVPEISEQNKSFSQLNNKSMWTAEFSAQWEQIHSDLSPRPEDIIITKRRISAFTGSDLEVVLRAQSVRHLILTGISTSGVVLSTVREAADKDFQLTVIDDCCADRDAEVHKVLTKKVFPAQAEVIDLNTWLL